MPDGVPHLPILYPFWGVPRSVRDVSILKGFEELKERGRDFLELKAVSDCDVAVLPFDWQFALEDAAKLSIAQRAAEEAYRAGRRLAVFFFHDSEAEVPIENTIVFRTSMQRGMRSNEFAHPAWIDDYVGVSLEGVVPLRPKWQMPTVGFCGFAGYRIPPDAHLRRRLRAKMRVIYRRFPPPTIRERAIRALRENPQVDTNFILRDNFFAGVAEGSPSERERARQIFVNNMIASDYILCARGGGNFSYRLYETLAMGRIPLLIDSNGGLPYGSQIDYESHFPIISQHQVKNTAFIVQAFHERLSPSDFLALLRQCRELWRQYLSPVGFHQNLGKHL